MTGRHWFYLSYVFIGCIEANALRIKDRVALASIDCVILISLSRDDPLRNNRKQYRVNNRPHYATKHRRISSMTIRSRTRTIQRNLSLVLKLITSWQRIVFRSYEEIEDLVYSLSVLGMISCSNG